MLVNALSRWFGSTCTYPGHVQSLSTPEENKSHSTEKSDVTQRCLWMSVGITGGFQQLLNSFNSSLKVRICMKKTCSSLETVNDRRMISAAKCIADFNEL